MKIVMAVDTVLFMSFTISMLNKTSLAKFAFERFNIVMDVKMIKKVTDLAKFHLTSFKLTK